MSTESVVILIKIAAGIFVAWWLLELFIAFVLQHGDEVPQEHHCTKCGAFTGEGTCVVCYGQKIIDETPLHVDLGHCSCGYCTMMRERPNNALDVEELNIPAGHTVVTTYDFDNKQ